MGEFIEIFFTELRRNTVKDLDEVIASTLINEMISSTSTEIAAA